MTETKLLNNESNKKFDTSFIERTIWLVCSGAVIATILLQMFFSSGNSVIFNADDGVLDQKNTD